VCRMLIHNTENAIPHPDDKGIFFCSPHCLKVALEESNTLEYEFSTN